MTETPPHADQPRRRQHSAAKDRDRISSLEVYWRRTARNLYIGVGLVAGGILILLLGLYWVVGQIQDSREDAATNACVREWRANSGIHEFILGPPLPGRQPPPGPETEFGRALRKRLDAKFPLVAPPGKEQAAERVCAERARARITIEP